MQFVKTRDLKSGMRLAKPIYNKTGILLFDRDMKITDSVIHSIESFNLIGIYILEPAEPLPPLYSEDIEFEQNQTIYMFQLRDCLEQLEKGKFSDSFMNLVAKIAHTYGNLDHLINFNQNLRSPEDFMYKHSVNTAILIAMLCHELHLTSNERDCLLSAALLYDYGYQKVPHYILEKGTDLTEEDRDRVQDCLEKGFEELSKCISKDELPDRAMTLIEYYIFRNSKTRPIIKAGDIFIRMASILSVAGQFDQLTAMNVNHDPLSEIMAMQILQVSPDKYPLDVVKALADCIHIVPAGASIDLSNRTKGIVLVENVDNFMKPLILRIDNNRIYDLSDPRVFAEMQIIDIMKTMDNRIAIDENTLKLFKADKRITETANRFRKAAERRKAAAYRATLEAESRPTPAGPRLSEIQKEEADLINPLLTSSEIVLASDSITDPFLKSSETKAEAPKKKKRKLT